MPTDLPVNPRETEKYKTCLANKRTLPSIYETAILQEDERRNARLLLQKLGYEHGDGAVDRISRLEFDGPGPEYSFEDGLRYMVENAPSVLSAVHPATADGHHLEGFTRTDIQLLDARIRHQSSAPSLRSYLSKFLENPSADEAVQDDARRHAIATTDVDATVFCPTVAAFRGTSAQARWDNTIGSGDIFVGQPYC
jgi:hypothetical protein